MHRIMVRRGGGLPEREFASVEAAAEWLIETGRSSSSDVGSVRSRLSRVCRNSKAKSQEARGGAYGFDWESRAYRVTRRGGGLPDKTFDSALSAARWCREAGLSKCEGA